MAIAGCVPSNHWVASTTPQAGQPSPADCMDTCLATGVPAVAACAHRCGATLDPGGCAARDARPGQICRTGDEHVSTPWLLVGLAAVAAFVVTAVIVTDNPFGLHTVHTSTGRQIPNP